MGAMLPEFSELDFQIGKRLAERRASLAIGLHDVADAASISVAQLQNFETGEERPSSKILLKLCGLLDLSLGDLLRDMAPKSASPKNAGSAVIIDFCTRKPRN